MEELENIKTSSRKDEETKYKARKLLHILDENSDKYKVVITTKNIISIIDDFGLENTPDNQICACAYSIPDILFITNDISCKTIAKWIFGLDISSISTIQEDLYKNYMLLPYVYTNAKQKMMYVCKKHYNLGVQVATAFNLSNEPHQCKGCIYDNAKEVQGFNFDDAKYIIEKSGENKLLSTLYTHANDRNLSISCSLCGNPYTTSLQKYQNRHQIICPSCRKKISFGKNSAHWKGGRSSLNSFLRVSIKEWKADSLKAANYKCDITNKNGYLEVHHLYKNFRDIVSETLEITHLDLRDNVGKYSQEELKLLLETCVDLHYKYGLGVCLLREYHLEFHEFYGHFNNTPEQYFLFKKEKQAELFQENQNIDSLLLCSNE